MTNITIKIPETIAEEVRRRADETGRDLSDLGSEQFVQYHEELGMRGKVLDRAFEREQDQLLSVVEARMADGLIGRSADKVFADLRARATADARARDVDQATIDRLLDQT